MRMFAAVLLLGSTVAALATPTDFNFKDVEVQNVCSTIAVLGRFNIVVDPAIGRQKLNFAVRQVEPLDALADVARQIGAQVTRIHHEEGTTTTTYMIGRPEEVAKQFGKSSRTIQLRYASVVQVARTLGERIEGLTGTKASIDERTNRLILTGTEEAIGRVTDLLRDVDLPVPSADVRFTLAAGPAGHTVPVWTGTTSATQGKVVRLNLGTSGAAPTAAWRLGSIEGKVQIRVNADDFMGIGLNVTAALEKDGVRTGFHWATEVQMRAGDDHLVGTVEISPTEVVTLTVHPTLQKATVATPPPVPPDDCPAQLDGGTPSRKPASPSPNGDLDLEGI